MKSKTCFEYVLNKILDEDVNEVAKLLIKSIDKNKQESDENINDQPILV